MALSQTLTTAAALQDYIRDFSDSLISKAYYGFASAPYLTPIDGVKGQHIMTELVLGNLVHKYTTADFAPIAGRVDFKPRTLTVQKSKLELQFEPQAFEGTYLGMARQPGFNSMDLPYEAYILMKVMEKKGQEIENAVWSGVNVTPDLGTHTLSQTMNGFLKIVTDEITAGNITATAVSGGTLTASNIVDTIEAMYDGLPDSVKFGTRIHVYLSPRNWSLYQRAYRDIKGVAIITNMDPLTGRQTIDFNGNCVLVQCPGMQASNRIIMTPEGNFAYGFDAEADFATLKVEENKRYLDFWGDMKLGVQAGIVDGSYIRVTSTT